MTANDAVVPVTRFLLAEQNKKNTGETRGEDGNSSTGSTCFADQLVLLRHGERQDHATRAWNGSKHLPVSDTPLSRAGRMQVFETALKYRAMRLERTIEQRNLGLFSYLLVSPFHRCIETAVIMNVVAFDGKLALFVDPQLSEWQNMRVYRTAPNLAGRYTARQKTTRSPQAMVQLRFAPQQAALRASLEPFFCSLLAHLDMSAASREPDVTAESTAPRTRVMEMFKITVTVVREWLRCVRRWLPRHTTLPVWTSQPVHDYIYTSIMGEARSEYDIDDDAEHSIPCNTTRCRSPCARHDQGTPISVNKSHIDEKPPSVASSCVPSHRARARVTASTHSAYDEPATSSGSGYCGVRFPESRNELQARVHDFMYTHYAHDDRLNTQVMLPGLVTAAVERERVNDLPHYFQRTIVCHSATTTTASTSSYSSSATPVALLPAMHVMAITHAHVIASVLRLCTRTQAQYSSHFMSSVPYCSVTALHRWNNYYTVPCVHERAKAKISIKPSPLASRVGRAELGGKGGRHDRRCGDGTCACHESSTEWNVMKVGSMNLLLTRIVLHFDN